MSHPLHDRYATAAMRELFEPERRARTWRRLWVALAEAERALGLPVSAAQVAELKRHVDDADLARVREWEKRLMHDVMAHIRAYGEQCPGAAGIIHLGATSMYVVDNTDLILMRDALAEVRAKLVNLVDALANFAKTHADRPCVGFTHFQPAQLTTVGRRACLWLQDFVVDLEDLDHVVAGMKFLGVKGAVGTQASFLELFAGDERKVEDLDRRVAKAFGFSGSFAVPGQTYTRKLDSRVHALLARIAESAHKMSNDLRLLAHLGEVLEPFGSEQVGSSAMAYKRNPMLAERIGSLGRLVIAFAQSASFTAATQWLERTLDDSAAKRVATPDAFLAADGMLATAIHLARGLEVRPDAIAKHVDAQLPFVATEGLLMEAVKRGANRQDVHERIRRILAESADRGDPAAAWKALGREKAFAWVKDWTAWRIPKRYVGRAPSQTRGFLKREVEPVLRRSRKQLQMRVDVSV